MAHKAHRTLTLGGAYARGVECIALNDEPTVMDVDTIAEMTSVVALAYAFEVSETKVARDIVDVRTAHFG